MLTAVANPRGKQEDQMTGKFRVMPNGDDAPTLFTTDDYEEARNVARRMSAEGHWLGHKVHGPSGKLMTFLDGAETGYLDGNEGWVKR